MARTRDKVGKTLMLLAVLVPMAWFLMLFARHTSIHIDRSRIMPWAIADSVVLLIGYLFMRGGEI